MAKKAGLPSPELFRIEYAPGVLRAARDFRHSLTRARFPLHSAEAKAATEILSGIDDLAEAITGSRTFFHETASAVASMPAQPPGRPARKPEMFSVDWWREEISRS